MGKLIRQLSEATTSKKEDYIVIDNNDLLQSRKLKIKNIKMSDLNNDNSFVTDTNYVHTDENFTTERKNKLASLENFDPTILTTDDIAESDSKKYMTEAQKTALADMTVYGGKLITNLNTQTVTTPFTCYGTATGVPSPDYSWFGYHTNSNVGNASATQTVRAYSTELIIYTRNKMGNVWGEWEDISSSVFVHKNEVVDNLTTTDIDVPLSANQGKILNEKASIQSDWDETNDTPAYIRNKPFSDEYTEIPVVVYNATSSEISQEFEGTADVTISLFDNIQENPMLYNSFKDLPVEGFILSVGNSIYADFTRVVNEENGTLTFFDGTSLAGMTITQNGYGSSLYTYWTQVDGFPDSLLVELTWSGNVVTKLDNKFLDVSMKKGTGENSTIFGDIFNNTASGDFSYAEGQVTTSTGYCSHAEGSYTTASEESSHAEGRYTTASGFSSHAEGSYTTASGESSHAEGSYTAASGYCSHAEGEFTIASGLLSHAEGYQTHARLFAEHAHSSSMGAQYRRLILSTYTENNTPTILKNGGNNITISPGTRCRFLATVFGSDFNNTIYCDFEIKGIIALPTNNESTAILGTNTTTIISRSSTDLNVTATANTSDGSLSISVTGIIGTSMTWGCKLELIEL